MLRSDLNEDDVPAPEDDNKNGVSSTGNTVLNHSTNLCPIGDYGAQYDPALEPGIQPLSTNGVAQAVARLLRRVHAIPVPPEPLLTARERNAVILARFQAGASQAELARTFGLSYQRIHQIVRGKHH